MGKADVELGRHPGIHGTTTVASTREIRRNSILELIFLIEGRLRRRINDFLSYSNQFLRQATFDINKRSP